MALATHWFPHHAHLLLLLHCFRPTAQIPVITLSAGQRERSMLVGLELGEADVGELDEGSFVGKAAIGLLVGIGGPFGLLVLGSRFPQSKQSLP